MGCFYWSWSIYCDFQLYLGIPLIVIVYKRSAKLGITLLLLL